MSKKNVELFTISPDQTVLNYGGYSKIIIDTLSQQLIVEPFNEDIKMISASFTANIFLEENIAFADSPGNLTNFVLIFSTPVIAKKVFNVIVKNRTTVMKDKNDDERKFIICQFSQLLESSGDSNIVSIRERYLKFCNATKANIGRTNFEQTCGSLGNRSNALISSNERTANSLLQSKRSLKRKCAEEDVTKTNGIKRKVSKYSQTFRCSKFKLFTYKLKDQLRKKLYIFDVKEDAELCHKYVWNKENDKFQCHTCFRYYKSQRISTAVIHKIDGKDYAEFGYHSCKAHKLTKHSRCEERKIIRKPAYKLIKGIIDGEQRQRLFIFDPTNMELCYVYSLTPNLLAFECLGCRKTRKSTRAKIYFEGTEEEYLEIYCKDHVCQLQSYNPEAIFEKQKILHRPYFEIETIFHNGRHVQRLFVFESEDRKYCHQYYASKSKTFRCGKCNGKGGAVYAKFDPKENILRLGANQHICEKQVYVAQESRNDTILENTKFKIIPSIRKEGSKQIIIFHKTDKTMGYTFSRYVRFDQYRCNGCKAMNATFMVTLCENENGEDYLRIKSSQKPHICTPKKLKGVEEPKFVKTKDFIFTKINWMQKS